MEKGNATYVIAKTNFTLADSAGTWFEVRHLSTTADAIVRKAALESPPLTTLVGQYDANYDSIRALTAKVDGHLVDSVTDLAISQNDILNGTVTGQRITLAAVPYGYKTAVKDLTQACKFRSSLIESMVAFANVVGADETTGACKTAAKTMGYAFEGLAGLYLAEKGGASGFQLDANQARGISQARQHGGSEYAALVKSAQDSVQPILDAITAATNSKEVQIREVTNLGIGSKLGDIKLKLALDEKTKKTITLEMKRQNAEKLKTLPENVQGPLEIADGSNVSWGNSLVDKSLFPNYLFKQYLKNTNNTVGLWNHDKAEAVWTAGVADELPKFLAATVSNTPQGIVSYLLQKGGAVMKTKGEISIDAPQKETYKRMTARSKYVVHDQAKIGNSPSITITDVAALANLKQASKTAAYAKATFKAADAAYAQVARTAGEKHIKYSYAGVELLGMDLELKPTAFNESTEDASQNSDPNNEKSSFAFSIYLNQKFLNGRYFSQF